MKTRSLWLSNVKGVSLSLSQRCSRLRQETSVLSRLMHLAEAERYLFVGLSILECRYCKSHCQQSKAPRWMQPQTKMELQKQDSRALVSSPQSRGRGQWADYKTQGPTYGETSSGHERHIRRLSAMKHNQRTTFPPDENARAPEPQSPSLTRPIHSRSEGTRGCVCTGEEMMRTESGELYGL